MYKKVDFCRIEEYFNECERRLNNKFSYKGDVELNSIGFEWDWSGSHIVDVRLNDNRFRYYNQTTVDGESYKENCDNHVERYCIPCELTINEEKICSYNRVGTYFGKYSHLHTHEAILYEEERVGISVYDVYEEFFSQFKKERNNLKDYKLILYEINISKDCGLLDFYICYEYKGEEYHLSTFKNGEDSSNIDLDVLFILIGEDVLSKYKR